MGERNTCDDNAIACDSVPNTGEFLKLSYDDQPDWIRRHLDKAREGEWMDYKSYNAVTVIDPDIAQAIRDIGKCKEVQLE